MVGAKDPHTRITRFRELMSKNQRMGSAGKDRCNFYNAVVSRAQEVR
jgi:hypothetical protein